MPKDDKMHKIDDELLAFKQSPLYEFRTSNKYFPVVGEGDCDANILFVGEAPGKNEAKTGKLFCGASGKFLTELIESIDLTRDKVYITNIVKDRPPENRDPTPEEITLYGGFLDRQIEIIQPRIIATLGRLSMDYVMKKFGLNSELEPIGKIHGRSFAATASYGPISIITLYHPAAALYNGSMRDVLKKDFAVLKQFESDK